MKIFNYKIVDSKFDTVKVGTYFRYKDHPGVYKITKITDKGIHFSWSYYGSGGEYIQNSYADDISHDEFRKCLICGEYTYAPESEASETLRQFKL